MNHRNLLYTLPFYLAFVMLCQNDAPWWALLLCFAGVDLASFFAALHSLEDIR